MVNCNNMLTFQDIKRTKKLHKKYYVHLRVAQLQYAHNKERDLHKERNFFKKKIDEII